MDYPVFQKQMEGMAVIYNEPRTGRDWLLKLDLYWARFKHWPDARFVGAVSRHVDMSKYFPRPSELLEQGRSYVADHVVIRPALTFIRAESAEDQQAREAAMAAIRRFISAGPPTTRGVEQASGLLS